MTIYEIKELTKNTSPYFFSRDSMRFFGQTLKDFKVYKQKDGKYLVIAESGKTWQEKHYTKRLFNPITNELEHIQD
jgi:protein associated with RNAse G/E